MEMKFMKKEVASGLSKLSVDGDPTDGLQQLGEVVNRLREEELDAAIDGRTGVLYECAEIRSRLQHTIHRLKTRNDVKKTARDELKTWDATDGEIASDKMDDPYRWLDKLTINEEGELQVPDDDWLAGFDHWIIEDWRL